jgi:hypothetical protein
MELIYKEILGFKFVKVGDFQISENPHPVTFNGQKDQINVCLQLVDESFMKSDESAYLIYVEDKLVYVGEFSYSLKDRWLRTKNYIWHNTDGEIEKELKPPYNKNVSLWLAVNPYTVLPNNKEINISKSIEQEILRQILPEWNKRGQLGKWDEWRKNNCVRVSVIIDKITNEVLPIAGGQ